MAHASSIKENRLVAVLGTRSSLATICIVLLGFAAYSNSLNGPFVFDDVRSIVENKSIEHLGLGVFSPPPNSAATVSGRPLLNASFAANHLVSGFNVWSYHLANICLLVGSASVLYGILWRTLDRPSFGSRVRERSRALALTISLLFVAHPLNTASVTYIAQRAETLMGLLFLLTLYGFIRAEKGTVKWRIFSVACCFASIAAKEVMVSAPLVVLLYDCTFVSHSFSQCLRRRGRYYICLFLSWVALAFLMVMTSASRGGSIGFHSGVSAIDYARIQTHALLLYLKLAFWPAPLIFDYGPSFPLGAQHVFFCGAMLAAMALFLFLCRKKALGITFCGICFFLILAPTSSVIPVSTELIAEHRAHLPLVFALAASIAGLHFLIGDRLFLLAMPAALALGATTFERNRDYRSVESLWSDTVIKMPGNPRAHYNLGEVFFESARWDAAVAEYSAAAKLSPAYVEAETGLGNTFFKQARYAEAVEHYSSVLRTKPDFAQGHYNLGNALSRLGEMDPAILELREAIRLDPSMTAAYINLGSLLLNTGKATEAAKIFEQALKLDPYSVAGLYNLGSAYLQLNRYDDALANYEAVLKLKRDFQPAIEMVQKLKATHIR